MRFEAVLPEGSIKDEDAPGRPSVAMKLAPNLAWREVLRGGGYEMDEVPSALRQVVERTAREMFQPIRDAFGGPLTVLSGGGLRSYEVNRRVGGAKPKLDEEGSPIAGTGSQHLHGTALDLKASTRRNTVALYDLIIQLQRAGTIPKGGCAIYVVKSGKKKGTPRFVHVDARGRMARWNHGHRGLVDAKYV
jgi:hypothetical protein